MVPSGPPTPGAQSVSPSFLRSNSVVLGAQSGSVPSESGIPSIVSPRAQYGNTGMLGDMPNVSSFMNHSFGNGGLNSALPGSVGGHRGAVETGVESDHLTSSGNGSGFNSPSSFVPSNMTNPQVVGQSYPNLHGSQILMNPQQVSHFESQNFQQIQQPLQQYSPSLNNHQQQHFNAVRGGMSNVGTGPVKLEAQVSNDQHGQQQQQQLLQSLRSFTPVKLDSQQMQAMRNLGPVKIEASHSDQSLFLQQQQQQQFAHMSRQSSQAAAQINLLHQQRLLQLQQQHQLLKTMPQQRPHLHQHVQQQSLPLRSPARPAYEPGMCARRIAHYMSQQQRRPEDNNIEFWRKFVSEYFAPNAKKKWCVSLYGSGRQTTGVVPQDIWHCEICNRKPGRGFEATIEVLPRLFKIKYESGTVEELLSVDMPREYANASGQIVLDYAKATQSSVFEQFRVVREGQLRIVFSLDLKICSWEFCARRHEELIPRRLLMPQVSQLAAAAQKYQTSVQNVSSNLSIPELQNNCNMFVASARQLAKALEVPLVNDLGYTKRYVRCLQISEVVNSMKDLIDYSRNTGIGPMESLAKFPRRMSTSQPPLHGEHLQQQIHDVSNQCSVPANAVRLSSSTNGVNNSTSATTITGMTSPYSTNIQTASPGSSSTVPPTQPNPSPSNPNPQSSPDPTDSQSSVQKIIREMMMSTHANGTGSDGKFANGILPMPNNGMRGRDVRMMDLGSSNGFANMPFDWKTSP